MTAEEYLAGVERELRGGRAARLRLLTELRDHLEDALAAGVDDAVARLGTPADVVTAWRVHVRETRARTRRRAALLALTLASTGALGVVQHASGHRPPRASCAATAAPAARAACERPHG